MKRKDFISSILPAIASARAFAETGSTHLPVIETSIPPYLKPGDTIGITSPAGYISAEDCANAVTQLEKWGFRVKIGAAIGMRDHTFGGTDDERTVDFNEMLNDPDVKAIMCARGGYGIVRIIDGLDFTIFRQRPKWIIGFSDVTVLHSHINKNFGIATLHSKMCNSFVNEKDADAAQIRSLSTIQSCLAGEQQLHVAPANSKNKKGKGKGQLVGGNLKTLESLSGTASAIDTNNKILFIEDTGEYLYSIDRMMWNLKRAGKLSALAGLVVGGFKIRPDDAGEEFGKTLEEIILEKLTEYDYPVCFDFPVGHQKLNVALKCGVVHELEVTDNAAILKDLIKS